MSSGTAEPYMGNVPPLPMLDPTLDVEDFRQPERAWEHCALQYDLRHREDYLAHLGMLGEFWRTGGVNSNLARPEWVLEMAFLIRQNLPRFTLALES